MSAVSQLSTAITSPTPIPAAHRTDAPVWAFHHAINVILWAASVVLYRASVWEHRAATRHPRMVVTFGCATIGAAILALVLFA